MLIPVVSTDPWAVPARAAMSELAVSALGGACQFTDVHEAPGAVQGSLVPIVSTNLPPLQIGLFSSEDGCASIARALLGFSPTDKLSRADIVDAVNEVVNMLSGSIKSRVPGYSTHAALGLPTFVLGPVECASGQEVAAVPVTVAGVQAFVFVVRSAR